MDLSAAAVARRLELPEQLAPWLENLEQVGPPPDGVTLPLELLERLGVVEPDLSPIVEAAPNPDQHPDLWWLLERACQQVRLDVGRWDAMSWRPSLPGELGTVGRCFWVYVFLAATDDIRRWHSEMGISDQVSWDTLADLGRHVARFRRRNGDTGLDSQFWISLHYRGGLFALGRLQFNPYRLRVGKAGPLFWYEGQAASALGPGFQVGDAVLGVHIPGGSPLAPDACDESFSLAGSFFRRQFPSHEFRLGTCTSWLMDEQLLEYLPSDSNIARFQKRFELVPGAREDDNDVFLFVFDRPIQALDELSPRTELERALVRHVRGGGHWRIRTGWLPL